MGNTFAWQAKGWWFDSFLGRVRKGVMPNGVKSSMQIDPFETKEQLKAALSSLLCETGNEFPELSRAKNQPHTYEAIKASSGN